MGVYVGPTCNVRLLPPPPPSPPVPVSLPQGLWVTGKGAGLLLVSSQLIRSSKGFQRLWSQIWKGLCHIWQITPHYRGTPLQVRRSRRQCSGRQQRWVGGWGGTRERRHEWGEGKRGGESYVQVSFWLPSSLEKKLWDRYIWIFTHTALSRHVVIIICLWSAALSRIDSRWKKCTLARQSEDIRKSRCTTGINNTGGKIAAGINDTEANLPPVSTTQAANFATIFASVVDTGGKFVTGVNDARGKLPPVSTTPAANCHRCKGHLWWTMGTIIRLLTT